MSKKSKEGIDLSGIAKAPYVASRISLFEELWAKQVVEFQSRSKPIKVRMPDNSLRDAMSWVTTPQDIAESISKNLGLNAVVAKVDETLWDMSRPFENDCSLEILDFSEEESKKVFWHSSSHILGYALERLFGCKLSVGPPMESGGFFYEADTGSKVLSEADYENINTAAKELVKAAAPFQRLMVKKEDAIKMFEYNEYKACILRDKVPEDGYCSVYRCGDLIDPCRGPHIIGTARVKAFGVTKNSSSFWQGKADQQQLQRVYGIAFPSEKLYKEWIELTEQAAKRDHRNVGKQQSLYMFHEWAPGAAFFFPHGARIYNTLIEFMRRQYRVRGYDEVITPNLFHHKLWECSGHWQHYSENMFKSEVEKEIHSLKPMNCPGHMLMFASTSHSYRELPIRFADFGVLHRNELSGALSGLTRVRRFQQDDAHIFVRRDQIEDEMKACLDFVQFVYSTFAFSIELNLSTRNPTKFLGDLETWNYAEARLASAMTEFCGLPTTFEDESGNQVKYDGTPAVIKKLKALVAKGKVPAPKQYWFLNPEDAAFYGPKIDIQVEDCMKRKHQCATVQLDFNLPERFKLSYVMSEEEKKGREEAGLGGGVDGVAALARPVVIHRAILGSLERVIAVLTEHWGGKWPLWISPRQIAIVPVSQEQNEYCQEVRQMFHDAGFFVDVDMSDNSLNKKVRNSQIAQYNMILVCGKNELENKSVSIRSRDNVQHGEKSLADCLKWLTELRDTYAKDY